jgi:citrate lyase subunit beta / citryl-CoA lyase
LPNGAWRPLYEYARSQCVLAAHALSVEAIDTVYVNYRDTEGLRLACEASRYDGFTGRFAIHPDQVPLINQAFTPGAGEVALARRIIAAFAAGAGVVSIDGKMFDIPHLKAARRLIKTMPADIGIEAVNPKS